MRHVYVEPTIWVYVALVTMVVACGVAAYAIDGLRDQWRRAGGLKRCRECGSLTLNAGGVCMWCRSVWGDGVP